LLRERRVVRRRHQRRREYAGRSVETNVLDARRPQGAQCVGEPQLVDRIGGSAIGPRLAEQAAGIARRVDLLVIELRPPRADQRPDRGRHRHELDFVSELLGVVVERRLHAVDAAIADAELVVVILDRAGPEADDIDGRALRPELAFAAVSDLL